MQKKTSKVKLPSGRNATKQAGGAWAIYARGSYIVKIHTKTGEVLALLKPQKKTH